MRGQAYLFDDCSAGFDLTGTSVNPSSSFFVSLQYVNEHIKEIGHEHNGLRLCQGWKRHGVDDRGSRLLLGCSGVSCSVDALKGIYHKEGRMRRREWSMRRNPERDLTQEQPTMSATSSCWPVRRCWTRSRPLRLFVMLLSRMCKSRSRPTAIGLIVLLLFRSLCRLRYLRAKYNRSAPNTYERNSNNSN